jgi:hypothetical protein
VRSRESPSLLIHSNTTANAANSSALTAIVRPCRTDRMVLQCRHLTPSPLEISPSRLAESDHALTRSMGLWQFGHVRVRDIVNDCRCVRGEDQLGATLDQNSSAYGRLRAVENGDQKVARLARLVSGPVRRVCDRTLRTHSPRAAGAARRRPMGEPMAAARVRPTRPLRGRRGHRRLASRDASRVARAVDRPDFRESDGRPLFAPGARR